MKKNLLRLSLTLAAAFALQACGGGRSDAPTDTPRTTQSETTAPPKAKASAQGTVYDASTGQALPGAQVTVAGKVLMTDSSGRFNLDTSSGQTLLVVASRTGYTTNQKLLTLESGSAGTQVAINLTPSSPSQSLSIAIGGSITAPGSTAQVSLPAAGLVDASTGALATGNASVTVTAIDPATQSRAMPGTFKVDNGDTIESFGAIEVTLKDANGRRLQLAPGKSATIRIPLSTRSLDTPASIPLYYLKESTGLWVQEGSATLKGNPTSGLYYEGTVSHFTTWNADRPITETVFVEGCVRNADHSIPGGPTTVLTDGLDYSSAAFGDLSTAGSFRVALKRNARATLVAEGSDGSTSAPVTLPPADSDLKLSECLVLGTAPVLPIFVQQTTALGTLVEGSQGMLLAGARGVGVVRYQWQRNGVNLPGQTGPILVLDSLTLADNGSKYKVIASNNAGSVASDELSLVVTSSAQQAQTQAFVALLDAVTDMVQMSSAAQATVDANEAAMLAPTQVCASGTLTKLTLDGKVVAGGEPISPTVRHSVQVDFAKCALTQDADLEGVLTGSALTEFNYTQAGIASTSTQLSALTDSVKSLQANGFFSSTLNTDGMTFVPAKGAWLKHVTESASSNTLTITGGSLVIAAGGGLKYQNLGFVLNGVTHVLNGGFSIPRLPTDEVQLQADGKQIGRLFIDPSTHSMTVEATGPIPAF